MSQESFGTVTRKTDLKLDSRFLTLITTRNSFKVRQNTPAVCRQPEINAIPGNPLSTSIPEWSLKCLIRSERSDRPATFKIWSSLSKLSFPRRPRCFIHLKSFLGVVHVSKIPPGISSSRQNFKLSSWSFSISCDSRSRNSWKESIRALLPAVAMVEW